MPRCICLLVILALAGCGLRRFEHSPGTFLENVEDVRTDASLTPQEKRDSLRAMGLSDEIINGVLREERLGNQFGGDLRTAIDKVLDSQLASLTPDETQAYADATEAPQVSDADAQQIVNLFEEVGLDSVTELEAFLDVPNQDVPGVDEEVVRTIFIDTPITDVIAQLPE